MQSNKGKLNKEDFKQLGIKAVMVAIAAALPVVLSGLQVMDFGQYQPLLTMVIFLLQYAGQRIVKGN